MAKVLFFFTSTYPFGKGETFIENEIDYLAEAFDKIIIVSNDTKNEQTRQVPKNVVLGHKGYELKPLHKIMSVISLLYKEYWKEYIIIKTLYKLKFSTPIINTMLQSWHKATLWQPFIKQIVKQHSQPNDSLYLYSYWNNDMALACARFKKQHPKSKAFARMHGWDVYFEANAIGYLPFRKFIFESLDTVFSISEQGKLYYESLFKSDNLKISVSKLGVPGYGKNEMPTTYVFKFLTISNLIPIKNLSTLINALSFLKINFLWTHIGDGYLKNELELLSGQLIPGRVEFKGSMKNSDVANYLKNNRVDLFVNVSLSEGIPVSIMEAFSFGIPCMATRVGGTPEIVNEQNGFLLPAQPSPDEISKCIETFYQLSEAEKTEKRTAAYQTWKNHYNAEINFQGFVKEIVTL